MKTSIAVAVVLVSGWALAADPPSKGAEKKDLEQLQGTWAAVSLEAGGKKAPEQATKGFKIVVTGNKLGFITGGTDKRESSFQLESAKTPKQIVVTPLDGPRKGMSQRGLYSIEKGTLRLLLRNGPGDTEEPPTKFATQPGDGLALLELKQEKPAADGAKKE